MLAIDISCGAKYFDVYAPWDWEYILQTWYTNLLGEYVKLTEYWAEQKTHYIFWHTSTRHKWWAVRWWDKIWFITIKWATTWPHLHLEKWIEKDNASLWDWEVLANDLLRARRWWDAVYFTRYDLWDVKQNDATPCIWASWRDLCELERSWVRTIAITSDVRNSLWIRFWDKVKLVWDKWCAWEYEVHDEMNKRYREECITRPWTTYCIKWDIPSKEWWACKIILNK